MIRTSLVLPPSLHQYLSLLAQQKGKKFSVLVRDILTRFADEQADQQVGDLYTALDNLKGMVEDRSTKEESRAIDSHLYGADGIWRQEPQTTGLWILPDIKNNHEQ